MAGASTSSAQREPSGRGRAVLATDWWPATLPNGTVVSLHTLVAADGEITRGTLYTRGAADTVFCLMHPRQDVQRHPIIPDLLSAGFAVWAQTGRDVNNDLRLIHEAAVLEQAADVDGRLDAPALGPDQFLDPLAVRVVEVVGVDGRLAAVHLRAERLEAVGVVPLEVAGGALTD